MKISRGCIPGLKGAITGMITIAIMNSKGGVAKTTTAVNLAAILARDHGQRVLLVDADAQANATAFCLDTDHAPLRTLADLLRLPPLQRTDFTASVEITEAIAPSTIDGVDLLPADASLMALDLSCAASDRAWTGVLAAGLPTVAEHYDFCLIDCPPAFSAASSAALLAADRVLIPIKVDAFSLDGMASLVQQIANMRELNPRLRLLGLLPVMWYRSDLNSASMDALHGSGLPVLPRIRRSDLVDKMTFARAPLIVCAPKSGAAQDYRALARRILYVLAQEGGAVRG